MREQEGKISSVREDNNVIVQFDDGSQTELQAPDSILVAPGIPVAIVDTGDGRQIIVWGESAATRNKRLIYVPLDDEGVDVWAPVWAEPAGPRVYRLPDTAPRDQRWAFPPGSRVVCETRNGDCYAVRVW